MLLFLSVNGIAQKKQITMYEYGDKLTTCETNFKNLFKNFRDGKFMKETSFGTYTIYFPNCELLEYRHIATLDTQLKVDCCAADLMSAQPLLLSAGIVKGTTVHGKEEEVASECRGSIRTTEEQNDRSTYDLSCIPRLGDEQYVIYGKTGTQFFKCYVICDSKTRHVIWDGGIFSRLLIEE